MSATPPSDCEQVLLEGVLVTTDEAGRPNISPIGPFVRLDECGRPAWDQLVLRPFEGSRTYANLRRSGQGVFHVVDDVLVVARGAIGQADDTPTTRTNGGLLRLTDCCRYASFEISEWSGTSPRWTAAARVTETAAVREFAGLHRARHAVLEAAILATRTFLLSRDDLDSQLARLRPLVEKTATARESEAWQLLTAFCQNSTTADETAT